MWRLQIVLVFAAMWVSLVTAGYIISRLNKKTDLRGRSATLKYLEDNAKYQRRKERDELLWEESILNIL